MLFRQNVQIQFFFTECTSLAVLSLNNTLRASHITFHYLLDTFIALADKGFNSPNFFYVTSALSGNLNFIKSSLNSLCTFKPDFPTAFLKEDLPMHYSPEPYFHFTLIAERLLQLGWFDFTWYLRRVSYNVKSVSIFNHLIE